MRALKKIDIATIVFVLAAAGAVYLLNWDKEVIKAFITGGVIASWLTLRLTR